MHPGTSQTCEFNLCIFAFITTTQAAALTGDLEPADLVGAVIGEVLVGLPTLQEQVVSIILRKFFTFQIEGTVPCAMLQTPSSRGARLWQESFCGASLNPSC